jgi:hypothetical protein
MTQAIRSFATRLPFLIAMAAGAVAMLATARPGQADQLVRAPILALETGADCKYYCRSCGTAKHDIVTAVDTNAESSHLENCNAGECSAHDCGSEALAIRVEKLWTQMQDASGEELADILASNADIAVYNPDRSAVQMNCKAGNIVASLPLTTEQVAELLE